MADPETFNKVDYRSKVVKVDLKAEIMRLAERGKIPIEDLQKEIVQTNWDYLRDLVRQFYAGRDLGYMEGVRDALMSRWPWWVWFPLGTAVPFAIKFAWKLVVFAVHVYNS